MKKKQRKQNKNSSVKVTDKKSDSLPIYIVIILFSFLIYGNTIGNDYALDDTVVIENNQFTKKGIHGLKEIFTTDSFTGYFGKQEDLVAGGRYRPFSIATFAIELELAGSMNPHLSHFINIFLYALSGLLIYLILSSYTSKWINQQIEIPFKHWIFSFPFIASLVFISHPIHTEVIANIKGRDEIIAFLGSLLALWFSLKYIAKNNPIYLFLSFFSFLMALLSKENAITFLVIIPLSIYFFGALENRSKGLAYKQLIYTLLPIVSATILFLTIRFAILGTGGKGTVDNLMNNPFFGMNLTQKYATILYTLGYYVNLLFIPHPLTIDYYPYHIPIGNWMNYKVWISLAIYILFGILALWGFKRRKIFAYSILIYLICLSIVSNIPFTIGTFMSERFIYFSSLGFCLILTYILLYSIPKLILQYQNKDRYLKSITRYFSFTLTIVILLLFSVKTISRNRDWKNDFTLFIQDVKTSPESAFSNKSAGNHLIEEALLLPETSMQRQEYLYKAIIYLNKAISIIPDYKQAIFLLGNANYLYNKNYKECWKNYRYLLELDPNSQDVHHNIPVVLGNCIDSVFRIQVYRELYHFSPDLFYINYYLGREYRFQNRLDSALFFLERAVKINPSDPGALIDYGVTCGQSGNYSKSAELHEKALRLVPNDINTMNNLVFIYTKLKNQTKVQMYLDRIKELKKEKN